MEDNRKVVTVSNGKCISLEKKFKDYKGPNLAKHSSFDKYSLMGLLRKILIILIVLIPIVVVSILMFNNYKNIKINGYSLKLVVSKKCSKEKLYFEGKNSNVYLVCLDSLYLTKKGEKISFDKYLNKYSNDIEGLFDDITSNLKNKDSFWDGGTTIYTSNNTDLGIIMCHTVDGNRDIYIGKRNIEYKSDYCGRSEVNEE